MKTLQESSAGSCRRRTASAAPAFEVEAADKERERNAEMDGIVFR
jgi:hypothetical protein